MKKSFYITTLALLSLIFTSCSSDAQLYSTSTDASDTMKNLPPATIDQTAPPAPGEKIAIIETSKGTITFKFFPEYAPETVKNFTELAQKGFYDKLTFHRVIPDFMIQGGDPSGNGTGGETYKGPGTTLKAEIVPQLKHINGAVSMARKGGDLNSATSQFFIVQNPKGAHFLDNQYTVFGQVVDGLDVVSAIANVKRNGDDMPLEAVVMKKVTIR